MGDGTGTVGRSGTLRLRNRAANRNNASAGNFGRQAGPRKVWRAAVFDGHEISVPHPASPQSSVQGAGEMAAWRGGKTMAGWCQALEWHASQVIDWKRQLLEGAAEVFGGTARRAGPANLALLHAQIGPRAQFTPATLAGKTPLPATLLEILSARSTSAPRIPACRCRCRCRFRCKASRIWRIVTL
jgi:hypothetical protein